MPQAQTLLHPGDPAPGFCLPKPTGGEECLDDLLAAGPVLLFFFRGTWCPNCRKQWRELTPWAPRWAEAGLQVRGIMAQSPGSVRAYAAREGFPFPMLLDPDRRIIKAYGVWHLLGIDAVNIARPSTFLIDQAGIIQWVFVSTNQVDRPDPASIPISRES